MLSLNRQFYFVLFSVHCHIQDTLSTLPFLWRCHLIISVAPTTNPDAFSVIGKETTQASSNALHFRILFYPVFFCSSMDYSINTFIHSFIRSFMNTCSVSTSCVPDTVHTLGTWWWTGFRLLWSLLSCPVAFLGDLSVIENGYDGRKTKWSHTAHLKGRTSHIN